jgi:hypothetical protein
MIWLSGHLVNGFDAGYAGKAANAKAAAKSKA